MAYIDDIYIENAIGEAEHDALFTDSGVLNTAARTQLIASADARIAAALAQAGYAAPVSTTTIVVIRDGSLGIYISLAYARRFGTSISPPTQYAAFLDIERRVGTGETPVPGLDPTAIGAVGGSQFSESSSSVTGNRAPVFTRATLLF